MGNALRFLYGKCCTPHDQDALGPHGVTSSNVGVSALAHDILHFDVTSQVPDRLSQYVVSSKKAQANWYRKLSEAWKETNPPPKSPEEASRLVVGTLKRHQRADVQGLLQFYGLPNLQNIGETTPGSDGYTTSLPPGVQYEIETMPVDAKAVADGDTITAYVDTADPLESGKVPREVRTAVEKRSRARAVKNYNQADAFQKVIIDAGYRVINGPNNEETLARKYRIRLRGIDAPESQMPFGQEAKEALTKLVQGKRLKIQIYDVDRYGRSVGDIYCSSTFVQEFMLKKGFAWHYEAYDKRPQLAEWEKQARSARRGLWAARNPQKPWEWRKDKRNGA